MSVSSMAAEENLEKTYEGSSVNNHMSIDEIYASAFSNAMSFQGASITNDIGAYSFMLHNVSLFSCNDEKQIVWDSQSNYEISEEEKNCLSDFIRRVNILLSLEAIKINSSFVISFEDCPSAQEDPPLRVEVIDLMAEARSHAAELRAVYENILFMPYLQDAAIYAMINAGAYFAQRVKTGGVWDYKQYYGLNTTYFITDINAYMDGETIGNFHYGYVGSSCFSPTVLKTAAGFAQILDGTTNISFYSSYFDDPSDQADIQWGINVYNSEH